MPAGAVAQYQQQWPCLLLSCRRWCLFPPQTPRDILKVPPGVGGSQKNEAITWFVHVYPKTRLPAWPAQFRPVRARLEYIVLA